MSLGMTVSTRPGMTLCGMFQNGSRLFAVLIPDEALKCMLVIDGTGGTGPIKINAGIEFVEVPMTGAAPLPRPPLRQHLKTVR